MFLGDIIIKAMYNETSISIIIQLYYIICQFKVLFYSHVTSCYHTLSVQADNNKLLTFVSVFIQVYIVDRH